MVSWSQITAFTERHKYLTQYLKTVLFCFKTYSDSIQHCKESTNYQPITKDIQL